MEVEPDRAKFLAHLTEFMEQRGTPIDRIPHLGHKEIDLHHLYKEVTSRGGLNELLSKKGMKEVAATFNLPSTCTNAGYALRVHYLKYLFPYERKFFHGLDDAVEPKRRPGRPSKEDMLMREEMKLRGQDIQVSVYGTRRSARRAASEAAARTAAAIATERGLPVPGSLSSSNAPSGDYSRTPIPKTSSRQKAAWASYHPALRLIVLALEAESSPDVDWALGTLLMLSYEEQLHLNAVPLNGLIDSLIRHSLPYHSFLCHSLLPQSDSGDDNSSETNQSLPKVPTKAERVRSVKVWEIIRNLSFVPENESHLADNRRFVKTAARVMCLESCLEESTTLATKRKWVKRLSRNALDAFGSVCHLQPLSPKTAAHALPALLYYLSQTEAKTGDADECVWVAVESLRKLTHESDNEALLQPFLDDILNGLAHLLYARDSTEEIDDANENNPARERRRNPGADNRYSDIAELKGAVLAVLLNLVKCSSKTACHLPAHPSLMRRLFGLLSKIDDEDSAESGDGEGEDADKDEIDGNNELDDEENNVEVADDADNQNVDESSAFSTRKRQSGGDDDDAADNGEEEDSESDDEDERASKRRKISATVNDEETMDLEGRDDAHEGKAATGTETSTGREPPLPPEESGDANASDNDRADIEPGPGVSATDAAPPSDAPGEDSAESSASTKRTEDEMVEGNKNAEEMEGDEGQRNGEDEDQAKERPAATTQTTEHTAPPADAVASSSATVKQRGAHEKLRKLASLVLSKLADDIACCEALEPYDGLIMNTMLRASQHPQQDALAALMHKLLLNIGLAASS